MVQKKHCILYLIKSKQTFWHVIKASASLVSIQNMDIVKRLE